METKFNNNTSFGMSFIKPKNSFELEFLQSQLLMKNSNIKKRGFKQFLKEQNQLSHFSTKLNTKTNSIDIIKNSSGNVVDSFSSTRERNGFDIFGEINYPFKKTIAKIFNPKRFINKGFYLAGERAKELEKEAIKEEKTKKIFS